MQDKFSSTAFIKLIITCTNQVQILIKCCSRQPAGIFRLQRAVEDTWAFKFGFQYLFPALLYTIFVNLDKVFGLSRTWYTQIWTGRIVSTLQRPHE